MIIAPFSKSIGRVSVEIYTDGYPYSTVIKCSGVDLHLHGAEEVQDLHYALGRLLDHIKAEEARK